jgi:elongation factor Tu
VKSDQIRRGQVVAAPRSLSPRAYFRCEVYVLGKGEGGRRTRILATIATHDAADGETWGD